MSKLKKLFVRTFSCNRRNRTLCLLLAVCMLLTPMWALRADATLGLASNANIAQAEQVINFYATQYNTTYTIRDSMVLKSLSGGDDAYTLYTLDPYGYAILLSETNSLMEACYVKDSSPPIPVTSPEPIYYGGPNEFFVKAGDDFRQILENYTISFTDADLAKSPEASVRSNELALAKQDAEHSTRSGSPVTHSVSPSYFSSLSQFGKNEHGTCTVLATAILLGYYDFWFSENYVTNMYEDGIGTNQAFHHLLNMYVYGTATPSDGGIKIRDAAGSINRYLDDKGITANFCYDYSLLNLYSPTGTIIDNLQGGKPVVASMVKSKGAEYNHTVVIYSVTYDPSNEMGSAVYTAHMGWDDPGYYAVTLNCKWFSECGYIFCGLEDHSCTSNWSYETYLQCVGYCDCGHKISKFHNIGSDGYCVDCDTLIP